ncbi:FtsX-like permease family protein [Alloscardovia omnicolens]|uniref:FtsX-like permease family protein n=1 Tax=Alloscardovia omnicolens TaxID=419015 RepID=UPI003A623A90
MASAMNKLMGANVRHHASRYISTAIAVTIASTFVVLCLTLVGALTSQYKASYEGATRGTAVVVSTSYVSGGEEDSAESDQVPAVQEESDFESQILSALKAVPGVKEVVPTPATVMDSDSLLALVVSSNIKIAKNDETVLRAIEYSQTAPLSQEQYRTGKAPHASTEIAIDSQAAERLKAGVGDTVSVESYASNKSVEYTVTGIVETPKFNNTISVYMTEEAGRALADGGLTQSYKIVPNTASMRSPESTVKSQEQLAKDVRSALADVNAEAKKSGIEFTTYESQRFVESGQKNQMSASAYMISLALIFPLLAAFVAAIIVGTTFRVIALQRRRELALLRAVGAQSSQVRALIFRETAIAGMVSSLIGVSVGAILGGLLLVGMGISANYAYALTMLPWTGIAITWLASSLITIFIGIAPARSASKVSPLAALSPVQTVQEVRRSHIVRLVVGGVLLAASIAGIVYGLNMTSETNNEIYARFGIVVLATFVCWIAAMIIFTIVLPYVIYAFGSLIRNAVGRLARGNVVRNPGRTASTGVAVMIGVVLMSTICVGVASVQTTIDKTLSIEYPIDAEVVSTKNGLTADEIKKIEDFNFVDQIAVVKSATAAVDNNADNIVSVQGYPDVSTIARSEMTAIADGTAHVSSGDENSKKSTLRLCYMSADASTERMCKDYKVVKDDHVNYGSVRISKHDLDQAVPNAPQTGMILRIKDGTAFDKVVTTFEKVSNDITLNGGYVIRAMYMQMLNVIVTVFMVLLGVTVLISLVGVANTLGLSVAERTQENGLLRALGLSRGQMRRLLVLESFLTAFVSTVMGIGLGIIFAIIGMNTLPFDGLAGGIHIALPYGQLGGLVLIVVLASMLAAWLPGRQASKVSPVEALASE